MRDLPHRYDVSASGAADGDVELAAARLPRLHSASPAEFDGPGDRWSPETLVVGAVAGCFVLTFRAVARASNVRWTSLRCDVTGTLDRIDRAMQFTRFDIRAHLEVPAGADPERARRALEKTERSCLISQSLKGVTHLEADVRLAPEREAA